MYNRCAAVCKCVPVQRLKIWGDSRCPTLGALEFSSVAEGHLKSVPVQLCGITQLSSEFLIAVLWLHFPHDAVRLNSNPEFDHG